MHTPTPSSTKLLVTAAFLTLSVGHSSFGQSFSFGSDPGLDGLGGFTTSAESGSESWSTAASSVNYSFGVTPPTGIETNDEGNTASLLRSFTLDRSVGSVYTIEGVVDLTNGYGDDNNRIGVLLFNDTATQTADGGGGLYFRVNVDNDNTIQFADGINGTNGSASFITTTSSNHAYNPGDDWIGQTLTFTIDITFKNDGTDDRIDVSGILADSNANTYSASASDLLASEYTGTNFGFASKWRYRDQSGSNRDVPAEFDYQSFSVTQVPESSSFALIAGAMAGLVLVRRRP